MIDVAVYPLHSCKDQVNMSLLSKVAERVRERERESLKDEPRINYPFVIPFVCPQELSLTLKETLS